MQAAAGQRFRNARAPNIVSPTALVRSIGPSPLLDCLLLTELTIKNLLRIRVKLFRRSWLILPTDDAPRDAPESMTLGVGMTPDILRSGGSFSVVSAKEGVRNTNADVLAKVILDIKVILEIESALADDLDFGETRSSRPLQDQLLLLMDRAGAVGAAKRIQAGYNELRVVK